MNLGGTGNMVTYDQILEALEHGNAVDLDLRCPSCNLTCVARITKIVPQPIEGGKYHLEALHERPGCELARSGGLLRWMQTMVQGGAPS